MEHESSFNQQLRKQKTGRTVMNKKIKVLEVGKDENT